MHCRVNAGFIVRGLEAISDFEYEFQMVERMNRALDDEIETVFPDGRRPSRRSPRGWSRRSARLTAATSAAIALVRGRRPRGKVRQGPGFELFAAGDAILRVLRQEPRREPWPSSGSGEHARHHAQDWRRGDRMRGRGAEARRTHLKALAAGEYGNVAFHRLSTLHRRRRERRPGGPSTSAAPRRRRIDHGPAGGVLRLPFDRRVRHGTVAEPELRQFTSSSLCSAAQQAHLNGQYTVWGRVAKGMEHRRHRPRRAPSKPDRMVAVRVAADAWSSLVPGTSRPPSASPAPPGEQGKDPVLVIDVAGAHPGIEIRSCPEVAPKHVAQIEAPKLKSGAYGNVAFHQVIDGFMAQTGDVMPAWAAFLPGARRHRRLGPAEPAARFSDVPFEGDKGWRVGRRSASSQFFIMFAPAPRPERPVHRRRQGDRRPRTSSTPSSAATAPNGEVSEADWDGGITGQRWRRL